MTSPSMVHRSGDTLVVRSVVSGDALYQDGEHEENANFVSILEEEIVNGSGNANGNGNANRNGNTNNDAEEDELDLPQCKIKRNYTCTDCNFYSQNPRSYLYHLKDVHKQKIRVYECPSCLYASKHSQKLQRHVHMVHVMNKRGNKPAVKKKKPKRAPLLISIEPRPPPGGSKAVDVVLNGERLKCSICGFATHNTNIMSRHEKLVHLKKRFFRCNKCNYVTHMRARYTKHVKYHSMPMIKCDLCDFRTPYKWNLDRHYKNHTGDGAFKCALCNFTADIKQSLTVHEMNHHVPPVGQAGTGMTVGRRRNKVGASDTLAQEEEIGQEEMELLRMEREDADEGAAGYFQVSHFNSTMSTNTPKYNMNNIRAVSGANNTFNTFARKAPKIKMTLKKLKPQSVQDQNERHNFRSDFINSDDLIHHKNGNVYIKTIKCRVCSYKAAWEGEIARHESKVHGLQRPLVAKKIPRPIPNLIPIQNKTTSPPPPSLMTALPILRIPSVRSRTGPSPLRPTLPQDHAETAGLSERDLNEICAKSCPNSSLRDFASLMGGADVFNSVEEDNKNHDLLSTRVKTEPKSDGEETKSARASPTTTAELRTSPFSSTSFKKKNASFFDKLKEKLLVGTGDTCNLSCWCGHESKCLSEFMRHQKLHSEGAGSMSGVSVNSGGSSLSSTRCQHCRQRCKTSSDLVIHLQSCQEANKSANTSHEESIEDSVDDKVSEENTLQPELEADAETEEEAAGEDKVDDLQGPHPMENKVFVWNSLPDPQEADCEEECLQQMPPAVVPEDDRSKSPISEGSLVGVETAPGYGAVTGSGQDKVADSDDKQPVKKVFKCPHCTFWASTASRFHVHIVGHLNKKPFECSLCAYRSNWRWDITKHIRLKSARDRNHESAGVLMTDETGRRNYSKYNKYLTMMRVHEPTAESSGSGRRTKATVEPTQGTTRVSGSGQLQLILPAPPKLTRAPDPVLCVPRPSGSSPGSLGTLRPPPPLRAAHLVFMISPRPQQKQPQLTASPPEKNTESNCVDPPAKRPRPNLGGKKTLWKCKKCNYRDASRELVLAHVKEHYQQRDAAQAAPSTPSKAENPAHGERHCRLKHRGDVCVVRGGRSKSVSDKEIEEDDSQDENDEMKKCETCSFMTSSLSEMDAHIEQHESGLQENQPESAASNDDTECESDKVDQGLQLSDGCPTKRYKCAGCPYVSNSKSQFLYHKQFHRPRGAPFKCGLCSYNVSRRHLLHQHLRVHGILIPPQKSPTKQAEEGGEEGADEIEEVSVTFPELDTRRLAEIPLVWVSRENKFFKMFKCRFCPHVNMRKANIHEHEKMHAARGVDAASRSSDVKTETPQLQQHHCPDCNYICNNAGVLSSHAKVHQGMYGQVRCLVDASRSDEAQIRELTAMEKDENLANQDQPTSITPASGQSSDIHTHSEIARHLTAAGSQLFVGNKVNMDEDKKDNRMLYFCSECPARFLFEKELGIHIRFHEIRLPHLCESCSYTARQQPHLLAHLKVHSEEYQERTNAVMKMFETSPQHPRPRTAVIVEGQGMQGPAWVVIGGRDSQEQISPEENYGDEQHNTAVKQPSKQYSCHLCPATFFKSVALQYHLSLHGGLGPHKCRYCDYAVKTYGNLVKHEMIHNPFQKSEASHIMGKGKVSKQTQAVPLSGTDLFEHRAEAQKRESSMPGNNYQLNSYTHPAPPVHVDPQFGILMHGSPDFVYPTYLKNGRLKEKRYKCHKCPSAFEKREQYKVHLSLHGAKQRYKCEKCDYSVKYYANYIQHMRKHQNNEQAMLARKLELGQEPEDNEQEMAEDVPMEISSDENNQQVTLNPRCAKTIRGGVLLNQNGPLQLSVADRQSLMLLQQKRTTNASHTFESCEEVKKMFWCSHCPYSSMRRDGVESHAKRHEAVSGIRGLFVCDHCDYSVPQQHFLREHNKLHFTPFKKQPEVYMKCSRTELWALDHGKENITDGLKMEVDIAEKTIVFQDFGSTKPSVDRFYPSLPSDVDSLDCQDENKIYMNIHTGEPVGEEDLAEIGGGPRKKSVIDGQDSGVSNKQTFIDVKVVGDESEKSSLCLSVSSNEDNKVSASSESDEDESRTNEMIEKSLSPTNIEVSCSDLVEQSLL